MSKLKLLHAADLHLDSPFEGLPAGKAAIRRSEQRLLLKKIAETAETEQVDMVLLAGDLFDSDSAYAETAEELERTLGSLSMPVFIAPGNHDYYSARSPYARMRFGKNVHVFRNSFIECVELPELGARVFGAAFTDKYSHELLRGFTADKKPGVTDILCIHGEVGGTARYNSIGENDIAHSGMDYIALGHIHTGSGLKKSGLTYYAWPGCPEGRGFDETGEKQIYIVEVGDRDCRIQPVCVAERKYEILPVEVGKNEPVAAIREALPENTAKDIYRIILRGETDDTPDVSNIKVALENRFFSLQLRDETSIRRDIWEKTGDDSLRGLFLLKMRTAYDAAGSDTEREKITQAVRWGLAAMDKREEVVRHDDR